MEYVVRWGLKQNGTRVISRNSTTHFHPSIPLRPGCYLSTTKTTAAPQPAPVSSDVEEIDNNVIISDIHTFVVTHSTSEWIEFQKWR